MIADDRRIGADRIRVYRVAHGSQLTVLIKCLIVNGYIFSIGWLLLLLCNSIHIWKCWCSIFRSMTHTSIPSYSSTSRPHRIAFTAASCTTKSTGWMLKSETLCVDIQHVYKRVTFVGWGCKGKGFNHMKRLFFLTFLCCGCRTAFSDSPVIRCHFLFCAQFTLCCIWRASASNTAAAVYMQM